MKTTSASAATGSSPQAKRVSWSGSLDSSSNNAGGSSRIPGSGDALQQNSSKDDHRTTGSSRRTTGGLGSSSRVCENASDFSPGGSSSTGYGDASNSRRSITSDRWVRWWWTQSTNRQHQQQQQEAETLFSRLLRRGTVARREIDSNKDMRSGRPTFERRRRRYRTVSWKYKKSIGFLASFVFLCNQILAPGLTSMPLTLIEYGWLPSLLVNLLFCILSSLCSLVLLRSVTLIEGNQNFDERFEYSATLRHFLAPPAADLPAGAAAARSAAAQSAALTETPGEGGAASAAAAETRSAAASYCSGIGKPFRLLRAVWRSFSTHSSAQQPYPLSVEAGGSDAAATGAAAGEVVLAHHRLVKHSPTCSVAAVEGAGRRGRGSSAVTSFMSKFLATATATACRALTGFGRDSRSRAKGKEEEGFSGAVSPAATTAYSSSGRKGSEDGDSCRISHPRSDSSSTRHSDYSQTVSSSGEELASASRLGFCTQAIGDDLPNFLLRRALYSLRRLSDSQRVQQKQQRQQMAVGAQQQTHEDKQRQRQRSTAQWDAAAARNGRDPQESRKTGGGLLQPAAAGTTSATNVFPAPVCETAASSAENGETCHSNSDARETLRTSEAPAAALDVAATVTSSAESSTPQPAGQQYGRGRLQSRFLLADVWLWPWYCVQALLHSPLHMLRWVCSLPHRLLKYLHGAVVRPPPLLPSSFPRLLSWLLHLNTFLSTCSAALLVSYCIDCLLLRVFSCSLFIPLLPTHVSSGAVLQQHGDGWMPYLPAVGHWIGAVFALILQPLCAVASLAASLLESLGAVGTALAATAASVTPGLTTGLTSSGTGNASAVAALSWIYEQARQGGNTLLLEGSRLLASCDSAAVRQISRMLLSPLSSFGAAFGDGFLQEQQISTAYGAPHMPFLYVLPSQHHIEEVFSGVCSSSWNSCSASPSSPAGKSSLFSAFLTASSPAIGNDATRATFDLAGGGSAGSPGSAATAAFGGWGAPFRSATAAAAIPVQHCVPQCVSHMGISVGYIITAAICLRLAAADLQENARLQLLSFGAIIAAVLQVSCSAALMLLFPTTAGGKDLPDAAAAAGIFSVTGTTGRALPATAAAGFLDGLHPTSNAAGGGRHAAETPVCVAPRAGPPGIERSSSLARCAAEPSGRAAAFDLPPTTPAASFPAVAYSGNSTCSSGVSTRMSNAAVAAAPATATSQQPHAGANASSRIAHVADAEEARTESSWPSMVVRGSGMGALVSTFVDAYSYSNALPSWANEIKDNIPVTQTLFMSTTFACAIYFLFGVLCAAAFPAFSASSNVLAAMLPSCHSLVAASCICFFHIFALLPNIVTSQISRRYDLLNMAICLDKPSAFYVASTMPWMLYWLLTFSPVFAIPSQLLTLLSNVLLNFAAPALVYVYALHATAPPTRHMPAVPGSVSFSVSIEDVTTRGMAVARYAAAGASEMAAGTPETGSHGYAVEDLTYEEDALPSARQKQEDYDEAGEQLHDRSWQQGELDTEAGWAAPPPPSVRVNNSAMYETTTSTMVPSTLSACVSRASSFINGGVMTPSPRSQRRRPPATRGDLLETPDKGEVAAHAVVGADADAEEQGASHAVKRGAEGSFIGSLAMQAVPEEEGNSEEEAHAAAVTATKHEDDDSEEPDSSLPLSLSHLHGRHLRDSISASSSGSVSRWSTSCFGHRRATAAREHGGLGGEDVLRAHSSGFKRTQSQNVLGFQSRTLGMSETFTAAEDAYGPGETATAKNLGGLSLHRGSTNVLLGQEREAKTLDRSGGTPVNAAAGYKCSTKTEEKLGKMRVAGAVAGGGGARSREVQRQLQTWLEEYSRQMPESEVAQLLHRQQREEQEEEMRLQQREAEIKKDLRKKIENQWRRQHIFRADEETSPSPSYGGGGSPARAAATLETVPEQSRSASLPPGARAGEATAADEDSAGDSSVVSSLQDDRGAAGNPMIRRRSSRSLSFGRFLLPQQVIDPGATRAVTSAAAGDAKGALAAEAAPEEAVAAAVAASEADAAAGDSSTTVGGGREGKHIVGSARKVHQRTRAAAERGTTSRCSDDVLTGEDDPATRQAKVGRGAVAVACAVDKIHRQQHKPPLDHEEEVECERHALAGAPAEDRQVECAGTHASRNWDTLSREGDSCGTVVASSSSGMRDSSYSVGSSTSGRNTDANSSSSTQWVVSEMVLSEMRTADAVSKVFPGDAGHDADAAQASLSDRIGHGPADASAVLVADARLQEKHPHPRLHQDGKLQVEQTAAAQAAPTFVRRMAKKCARIDSVSVALQQRRRQQLLKKYQEQEGEQQQVQEQRVEQNEDAHLEHQQEVREPQQHKEQHAEVEPGHHDEAPPRSEPDAQPLFSRSSIRHATYISRGRGHDACKKSAVKSCTHGGDTTSSAGGSTISAFVPKDRPNSAAECAREVGGTEGEAASGGAGEESSDTGVNRSSDTRSDRGDTVNEKNIICGRSSVSEGAVVHSEVCNGVNPRGSVPTVRIGTAPLCELRGGHDVHCAISARTPYKEYSSGGVDGTAEHSVLEDIDEHRQLPPAGIQPQVVHSEVWEQPGGTLEVSEQQNGPPGTRRAAARESEEGGGGGHQRASSSSKANRGTDNISDLDPLAADLPVGKTAASQMSQNALVRKPREIELHSAGTGIEITDPVTEKVTESYTAAVGALASGPRSSVGVKKELSHPLSHRCGVRDVLKAFHSAVVSFLRGIGYAVSNSWNSVVPRVFSRHVARGAAEEVPLTRHQPATNGIQERVSFFPWLKSTEEQLVATYALLAVVLYCAAAALADEMWSALEPVWLYIWRHSCRLVSLLWAVEWPLRLLRLVPFATWLGATLSSGVAAAEYLLLLFRDSYIIECLSPWFNVSVKKMQRVAGWLHRAGNSAGGRPLQQAYGAEGNPGSVQTLLGSILETARHQSKGSISIELATSAVQRETAARLNQGDPVAQELLNVRAALPTQTLFDVAGAGGGNVEEPAGLSAEAFFVGLFFLIACALPLLRYASPAGRRDAGSRRQSSRPRSRR